jgi:predicted secreted protein
MAQTFTACAFAAAVLLAGCATTEAPSTTAAAKPATAGAEAPKYENNLTGSRLSKGTGDRHLRSVGNQSARDEFNATSMGNLVGIKGN